MPTPPTRRTPLAAYLNAPVDYGGETITRADRRRRLLEAGLTPVQADRYEQGADLREQIAAGERGGV